MDKSDRRDKGRVPLELRAEVSMVSEEKEPSFLSGLTRNVSSGGAFFLTDQPLPPGTELDMDLILPIDELKRLEGEKATIKVSGVVIRRDKKGMAIHFTGLKILCLE